MKKAMPAGRQGLTLIECAIGIVIISISFYTLIAVFITLIPRSVNIEGISSKTYLAQEKMEEYLARPFTLISTAGATGNFSGGFSNYLYRVLVTRVATADLSTPAGASNFSLVKVRVWGGPVATLATIEVVGLAVTYEVR